MIGLGHRLALGLSLAALLAVGAASTWLDLKARNETVGLRQTLDIIQKVTELRLRLSQAESAARGYGLSGQDRFITDYQQLSALTRETLGELSTNLRGNPAQLDLLTRIGAAIDRRLAVSSQLIQLRQASDFPGIDRLTAAAPARSAMAEISALVDRFNHEESLLLDERSTAARLTSKALIVIDLTGLALVIVLGVALIRQARRQLRHSSAILENTFNTMAEGVLVASTDGIIQLSNAAVERFLGTRIGKTFSQMKSDNRFYEQDGTTLIADDELPIARTLRGESTDRREVVVKPTDGRPQFRLMVSGRPLRSPDGDVTAAAMVYHDITEVHETERKLQQAQKLDAIGKLTGGVAHDFNNMLTIITGSIETLGEDIKDRPEATEIAALIGRAADRCTELIRHLLAFARVQPLRPRKVDLNATVLDVAKLLRPTLGEQIEINAMIEDDVLMVHVDPAQLANSLVNLAINARDAMPDGGKLLFETRTLVLDEAYAAANPGVTAGPYIMVAVSDSGTGMPPEVSDRAFEPFFTTKEVGKGSGLGLSMVYGFAKQCGGHVKIYSEEGRGTTVRLYLPPQQSDVETELAIDAATPRGAETILVVEDDPLVRDFVLAQLQGLGYTTIPAARGADAMAHVEAGAAFDLLFTDVIMPGGMNGRELAAKVRQLRPDVKVLFTSGYTDNAIVAHGRLDHDALLLSKPYRRAELAQMVRRALTPASPAPRPPR